MVLPRLVTIFPLKIDDFDRFCQITRVSALVRPPAPLCHFWQAGSEMSEIAPSSQPNKLTILVKTCQINGFYWFSCQNTALAERHVSWEMSVLTLFDRNGTKNWGSWTCFLVRTVSKTLRNAHWFGQSAKTGQNYDFCHKTVIFAQIVILTTFLTKIDFLPGLLGHPACFSL